MIKTAAIDIAKTILPAGLKRRISAYMGRHREPTNYQGVVTPHNMQALHSGRFAEIHDRHVQILHDRTENSFRLRSYFLCLYARQAARLDGDFLAAGISYGIANHIVYDYVDFPSLGKIFHYVDPFTGSDGHGGTKSNYNTDIAAVKSQYPADAPIKYHQTYIPDGLPLDGVTKLSLVYLNTGAYEAEAASLPWIFEKLVDGGFILIDNYSVFSGQQDKYDPIIKSLGTEIFTLPTGQGIVIK